MSETHDNFNAANDAVYPQEEPMAKRASKTRTHAEKATDFKALANKHAGTARKALERLAKLARPGRYAWTEEQVKKLETAIQNALVAAVQSLSNPEKKKDKVTADIL